MRRPSTSISKSLEQGLQLNPALAAWLEKALANQKNWALESRGQLPKNLTLKQRQKLLGLV